MVHLTRSFTTLASLLFLSLTCVSAGVVTDASLVSNSAYDYIIVGGGLAGLTVANRLSASSFVSVLVIEAGNDDRSNPNIYDVSNYGAAFSTDLTFRYTTTPQIGGRTKEPKGGRTLGGSTSINGAAWNRGHKAQYDALGELVGQYSDGWNWDGLLGNMKQSEKFVAPNARQKAAGARYDASTHGFNGPLEIRFSPIRNNGRRSVQGGASQQWKRMFTGPQQAAFIRAVGETLGVQQVDDQCSGNANSVAYTPTSIDVNNNRVSAATAYYSPIENRPNLTILTGTRAKNLIWDSSSNSGIRSSGVVVQQSRDGNQIRVTAKREVILAAGALSTPAILQRSGVGSRSDLNSISVDQKLDLPGVGKNLQDQTLTSIGSQGNIDYSGGGPSNTIAMPTIQQIMSNSTDVRSYINSNLNTWADQLVSQGHVASKDGLMEQWNSAVNLIFDQQAPVAELFFDTGHPRNSYGLVIWPLLPFSRGSTRAVSQNPFDMPRVDPNYFGLPIDMDMQVASLRASRRVLQNDNLKSLTYNGETTPGFDLIPDGTHKGRYSRWRDWVLGNTGGSGFAANNHQLGTASMQPREKGGVVDGRFKVYGTKNVRVVDASALPVQVSAHLSSTLYGMAEKAADTILKGN
ncbi:hypothetical protein NDA18_005025 [Ustilago nuda]|nr:hypothetical protein NDA18_005025 [Ustilago nuda]